MTKKKESLAVIHRHLEEGKTRVIDRVAYNSCGRMRLFSITLIDTPLIGKEMIREFCKGCDVCRILIRTLISICRYWQ